MLALSAGDALLAAKRYSVLVDSGICELAAVEERLTPPPESEAILPDTEDGGGQSED